MVSSQAEEEDGRAERVGGEKRIRVTFRLSSSELRNSPLGNWVIS